MQAASRSEPLFRAGTNLTTDVHQFGSNTERPSVMVADNLVYLLLEKLQARRMQGQILAWMFIRFLLFLE
ncbi:hypothetical protein PVAP13_9KG197500 [Panicum virgatum]|uniref:Uncharacterized protein n=1 Tax=Panicum virgatum TaxID=38727 RepID=A0A8T0NK56_PANVG|nr:hypothetical protein PVAP13_9KG197500 [Panicum virgatum]